MKKIEKHQIETLSITECEEINGGWSIYAWWLEPLRDYLLGEPKRD